MTQNSDVFSHDVRITTCRNCGAPLNSSPAGGSCTCEYCSTDNQVAPLWASGGISRWTGASAVSESERIAQLRLQSDKPHPEPKIEFVVDGIVPKYFVRQATEKWKEMRVQLEKSNAFTLKEQLFFLTLHLAPSLDDTTQRAFLETAIEILDDERYRQILLGLLVRIAARKGNVDAASGWLAYLNPCSMDLEMDTAYRYAAATICAATSDTTKIGELLGFKAGDIPLSHRDRTACRLLQIHAVELNGDIEKAGRALWSEINDQGEKKIKQRLARHLPLAVCPQSIAWVEAQQKQQAADKAADEIESAREVYRDRIERFQQKIELHKGARYKTYGLATLIVTAALLIANIFWTAAMLDSGHDPWFGAASPFICARVCDGCTPPIVLRGNGTFCVAPVDASIALPYTEESQVLFLLVVLVVMLPGYAVTLSIVLFKVRSSRRATRNRLQTTLRETKQKLSGLDIKT